MALVKVKPTSAGRRGVVKVVSAHLHKGKPLASLTEPKIRGSGRNNSGRITIRLSSSVASPRSLVSVTRLRTTPIGHNATGSRSGNG